MKTGCLEREDAEEDRESKRRPDRGCRVKNPKPRTHPQNCTSTKEKKISMPELGLQIVRTKLVEITITQFLLIE